MLEKKELIKPQKIARKEISAELTTLKDLLLEASKIYVLGMKKFIADKQKLLNL